MRDEFLANFSWLSPVFERPIGDLFAANSIEYAALAQLKEGWGKRDTAELLKGLTAQFGDAAGRAVDSFLESNIRRDWIAIGEKEAHEGTEIDDIIRIVWNPVNMKEQGYEFTIRRENGSATLCVTKCPIYELAKKTRMHDWLYRLACATDYYTTPSFSPKIAFTRTKTLMRDHVCCDHRYDYITKSADSDH